MPSENPLLRLEDILENIERIELYVRDHGPQDFADDGLCRDAVERCLLGFPRRRGNFKTRWTRLHPINPGLAFARSRNVLRHEYDADDPAIIWKIVANDLPSLKIAVNTMLAKFQIRDDRK